MLLSVEDSQAASKANAAVIPATSVRQYTSTGPLLLVAVATWLTFNDGSRMHLVSRIEGVEGHVRVYPLGEAYDPIYKPQNTARCHTPGL